MFSLFPVLLLVLSTQASILTLKSPRFTVADSTGSEIRSETCVMLPALVTTEVLSKPMISHRISLENKPSTVVDLSRTDILKITFQVVNDGDEGVQPHQTFLRFYDEKSGEEGIQPIRVTAGGKAKFELVCHPFPPILLMYLRIPQNLSKPPLSLPPTPKSDPLRVTLLIGSSLHDPLSVDLFDLILPLSLPAPEHPDAASYHPLPEIKHTFRPDHKLPPRFISAVSAALVVAPWAILLNLVSSFPPSTVSNVCISFN